jgi:hypothetical protein
MTPWIAPSLSPLKGGHGHTGDDGQWHTNDGDDCSGHS